jgi:hypothetical protein
VEAQAAANMLSGELASRAAKLKREQQERIERRQQRELADRDALRRQQERLQAAEEEGRRRRLEELARQDELRLQVRMHFVPEPHSNEACDCHPSHPAAIPSACVTRESSTQLGWSVDMELA